MEQPKPIDPALAQAICDNLEISMPLGAAAEAEGVARSTVYDWTEKDEGFARQVTRARAQGLKNLVKLALEGGKGSSAANWHLERRFREEFVPPKAEVEQRSEVKIVIEGGLPEFPQ